jgi:F-type H+-transporting ATPase subunit gamma
MPTTREIRRRITSVKKTQKITDAMEKVASIKMRRARDQILNARPYVEKLTEMAGHLKECLPGNMSPLLCERPVKTIALVIVGSDKGLCGAFNSNVIKKALEFIKTHAGATIQVTIIGKKPSDALRRRNLAVTDKYLGILNKPRYADVCKVGEKLLAQFSAGTIDEVYLVYNFFKNVVSQKPMVERVLPIPAPEGAHKSVDYIFEPDPAESLDVLLSRYFTFQIWRAVLESYASYQGAQMAAMSGATKNAGELIGKLTLYYNKARQAAITKELLEVVGGAEALK